METWSGRRRIWEGAAEDVALDPYKISLLMLTSIGNLRNPKRRALAGVCLHGEPPAYLREQLA